jgi:hypothetical protein
MPAADPTRDLSMNQVTAYDCLGLNNVYSREL